MLLFTQFKDYNNFKERFGYKTDSEGNILYNKNGSKQRKNSILFYCFKESFKYFKNLTNFEIALKESKKYFSLEEAYIDLKNSILGSLDTVPYFDDFTVLEKESILLDNDSCFVIVKNGKREIVKIGKILNLFIDLYCANCWYSTPVIRNFFIESYLNHWKAIKLKAKSLKLVINDDFEGCYSYGRRPLNIWDFGSCMDDKPNWKFYKNHSDIFQVVSLQDSEGQIYARCLLVTCYDSLGNSYKYLDRIYFGREVYKFYLFEQARSKKLFDLYRHLSASCRESTRIYSVINDSQINFSLYIPIEYKDQEIIAYQDTFKFYNPSRKKAYNSRDCSYKVDLSTTTLLYQKSWEND